MSSTEAKLARIVRKDRIVGTAREIAESEGWAAVTVRRLADSIGYSQPVLYGHFPDGRAGIVRAVAVEGFASMAASLAQIPSDTSASERLRATAECYLRFARDHAAVYEAMFGIATDLAFATVDAGPDLRAGFGALAAAVGHDETRTEVLWSTLHGLAELTGHGRLRDGHQQARVAVLVELFARA